MHDAVTDWQELSALYEKADQLAGVELAAWLATLRAEGQPLLEPLLQMLGARSEVRDNGFLDALPILPAPPLLALGGDDWHAGARIGPYRLERPVGTGGMAEVWMAQRDDGAFQRTVAIKLLFLHARGGGPQRNGFAQRFTRERDILASLHHPNIAALHDAGVTPAGQPWLALEYVEGKPLTTWCDRAKLDVRGRVGLFQQVLLAVQHAHANLVIHRDLKPANILVTTTGEVRLLDFGIAKLMEAEGDAIADTELTRHAGRLMTVRYASPEQLTGQPLTTACDVYSLGVVLYELLSGELPYETKVDSAARLEQAILEVEPRAPSRRALGAEVAAARESTGAALRKLLGSDLDAIVLRALAKRPGQRYASVEALRVELERWLAGEPVEARAPTSAYRLRKFVGRHVVGVSLGSAAVVALVAVAASALWMGLQARQESARATAARDFMMGMFKQADSDKSHGADMTARQLLDRGRDDVLKRLKGQPELQADLLEGIAGIQAGMEEYAKADVTFERLADVYGSLRRFRDVALAVAARADNAMRMGNHALAHQLIQEVPSVWSGARGDVELNGKLYWTEGWLALAEGHPQRSKELFQQGLTQMESAFGPLDRRTLNAMVGLVRAEAGLKNFDAAISTESKFEERSLRAPDRSSRESIGVDLGFAELLYLAGRYRDAADRDNAAVPRCVNEFGLHDAWCQRLIYGRAAARFRLGAHEAVLSDAPALKAIADDPTAIELRRPVQLLLFRLYAARGELSEHAALRADIVALGNTQTTSPVDVARVAQALQALAEEALREDRLSEAEHWLAQAQAKAREIGDARPGYAFRGVNEMLDGLIQLRRGHSEAALQLLRQACSSQGAVFGDDHPTALLCSSNTGRALATLGRYREASVLVRRAQPRLKELLGEDSPVTSRLESLLVRLQAQTEETTRSSEDGSVPKSADMTFSEKDFFYN